MVPTVPLCSSLQITHTYTATAYKQSVTCRRPLTNCLTRWTQQLRQSAPTAATISTTFIDSRNINIRNGYLGREARSSRKVYQKSESVASLCYIQRGQIQSGMLCDDQRVEMTCGDFSMTNRYCRLFGVAAFSLLPSWGPDKHSWPFICGPVLHLSNRMDWPIWDDMGQQARQQLYLLQRARGGRFADIMLTGHADRASANMYYRLGVTGGQWPRLQRFNEDSNKTATAKETQSSEIDQEGDSK